MRYVVGRLVPIVMLVLVWSGGCGSDTGLETAATEESETPMNASGSLIFHTGFETGVTGTPADAHTDLTGTDGSVASPNNFQEDLEAHPKIGRFSIQYQGGELEHRYARLIDDPTQPDNRVLHFWLKHPRTPAGPGRYKGRIQANVYGNDRLRQVYSKRRLFLHEDFNHAFSYQDGFGWLTLEELWFGAQWRGDPNSFRITLNLRKYEGGDALYFDAHGQEWDPVRERWTPTVWSATQQNFVVPIGTWMTLETYYRQGNAETGRFYLAVTPDGGERAVVFDMDVATYHPSAPDPIPMTHWNPMKLYTSSGLIDHVREAGGVLQMYWDDWEVWDGWPEGVGERP